MDINITIFFQAIQFGIAYFFLYKYLFAPAYKVLYEQELFEKKLYENLEQEKEIQRSLCQNFNERQVALRSSLMKMVPIHSISYHHEKINSNSMLYQIDKVKVSSEQIEKTEHFLIDNLSQVIK